MYIQTQNLKKVSNYIWKYTYKQLGNTNHYI